MSVQARQEGINVVQFTLYPNGTISTPVISKSSKYFLLDDNTIETIQAAYKDYPRPQKPTLIRIYVKYSLR
jgi:protein TonB